MESSKTKKIFICVLLLHCFTFFLQGCHSSKKRNDHVQNEKPAPNRLMQAILDEFKAQNISIYLRDDRKLLVVSEYEFIGKQLRHRYFAKVLRSNRGLFFKLRSVYERLDRREQPAKWIEAQGEATYKKAYLDEQKLGIAIRDRFH